MSKAKARKPKRKGGNIINARKKGIAYELDVIKKLNPYILVLLVVGARARVLMIGKLIYVILECGEFNARLLRL